MKDRLLGALIVGAVGFGVGWYPEFAKRTKAEQEAVTGAALDASGRVRTRTPHP